MRARILAVLLILVAAGGLLFAALNDATAQTKPIRATRAEVAAFCQGPEALLWGVEEPKAGPPPADAYGCISSRGWIRCDHYGNCAGGDGAGARFYSGREARAGGSN